MIVLQEELLMVGLLFLLGIRWEKMGRGYFFGVVEMGVLVYFEGVIQFLSSCDFFEKVQRSFLISNYNIIRLFNCKVFLQLKNMENVLVVFDFILNKFIL